MQHKLVCHIREISPVLVRDNPSMSLIASRPSNWSNLSNSTSTIQTSSVNGSVVPTLSSTTPTPRLLSVLLPTISRHISFASIPDSIVCRLVTACNQCSLELFVVFHQFGQSLQAACHLCVLWGGDWRWILAHFPE